jgi:hypothetical protein
VTDTSEKQEVYPPLETENLKPNRIAKFCREYELLDSHRKRNSSITILYIFYLSYLISLVSLPVIPKSTWGWWTLCFGLILSLIASDMISIGPNKLGSIAVRSFDSLIGGDLIYASDEIKYGNEILRIGFTCQLLGLILSLIDP